MTTFIELLASIVATGNVHTVVAPASWSQGRTLYGGISSALRTAIRRQFLGCYSKPSMVRKVPATTDE